MFEEQPGWGADRRPYDFLALGAAVAEARHRAGLSLRELAERSGVVEPELRSIERGGTAGDLEVLHAVAHVLGVGFGALISAGDVPSGESL
ncbi:helix-turn-helix domain-containing protein [Actinoplanes xinjiangensis]|uniref:helix-turn-helix domain-containing protein n=1 Tax=Actinoplanes xinjiangensis TaxID=512350 RepID=UPI003423C2CF